MTTTNNAPVFIDVYALDDSDASDPDPIYYATANNVDELQSDLIDAMGDVTLEFLFADADTNVYNVRNADNVLIAIARMGTD
ncbi:hypothetical protein [Mycobacterium conspicuum]|nr:hypothetical protein [Mycobacterium conspicuum]ORV40216.1 hypothetical protein AWC00_16240 [Mycobacterium conspicuum]